MKRLETAIDDGIVSDVDDALQSVDVTELEDDDTSFLVRAAKRGTIEHERESL